MDLAELEATLPNGFHDAILETLAIDFNRNVATLSMSLWIGLLEPTVPQAGRTPVMRRCRLSLDGLAFLAIDPPRQLVSPEGGVNVSGESLSALSDVNLPPVAKDVFVYAFYACDWNSLIYVAAREVVLDWMESEEDAWSNARVRDSLDE
jgi:hypothetical protein